MTNQTIYGTKNQTANQTKNQTTNQTKNQTRKYFWNFKLLLDIKNKPKSQVICIYLVKLKHIPQDYNKNYHNKNYV